jgi:hypothetical protein
MVHGTFEVDLTTEIGLFCLWLSDPLASWLADVAAFAGKSICVGRRRAVQVATTTATIII